MSIPSDLSAMEKMQNMKNMLGEGFMEYLKPSIKSHQNENVLKFLELAKDKPDSCIELLSVAIFHNNIPIIKSILEKLNIQEIDSPYINAFSFYNSILTEDSKDKLTDSKDVYMDIQVPFVLMAGISGQISIFEYLMSKNLIKNRKLTGIIGLSKKHKNAFISNVIGACAYYGRSKLLSFLLKNYKDELDINIVSTEKKVKNTKLAFSKEYTGCTPSLLAVVGPSGDKDTLEILKILNNYDTKFTAIDYNKNNILHLATKNSKIETAKYICNELGLKNLNNENNSEGYTPFSLAQHMNNETFINFFYDINKDDEKRIEEDLKELLADSEKRDAKENKNKKKKKKGKNNDDIPVLLNSTEYQETLKSVIIQETPEKEEDDFIIGLNLKKNKKNKKIKMGDSYIPEPHKKKEIKESKEIKEISNKIEEPKEIKEEPKNEIKEEPKKEKKTKIKKLKKEKRSDKEATDEFLEKMRQREKERQETIKLEEEKKRKEKEEREEKEREEQKRIEEELRIKKEQEEKERKIQEEKERKEKEEQLKKEEEQKLMEEEEKESISSNDDNNIINNNDNNISENNKDIKSEKEVQITPEDYEKLNKKYLNLEKKLNQLEQEKEELTSCLTKLYLENKSSNKNVQILNNEENINDLMYLANKELENKNEIINELENKLTMLDLTNIKNFSIEKLKIYKDFYDKNLKIINNAMK